MSISFAIDTREFQKAMREYESVSKRDAVEIVNKIARDVAYRSAQFTPKSSESKIRRDFLKKTGGTTLKAYKIINAYRRDRGLKPIWGYVMGDAVQRWLNSKYKSVGFLRAGWAEIVMDLGGSYRGRSGNRRGLGKGIKARGFINPTATLYYYIPDKQFRKSGSKILSIAFRAIQKAIAFKTNDMRKYIERKLAQRAKQFSAG